MQKLFSNYHSQINDYGQYKKSQIWDHITSNSFKNIDSNKLRNFFNNNLSDGISVSRLTDENKIKKLFLDLCNKYKKIKF